MSAHDRRRGGPRGVARPPRHWIKRPPRPSRPAPPAPPPRTGLRQLLIAAAAAIVTGLVAAYVAANTLPRPEMTMMALGLGGALGGALAWRAQGGRFGPR